MKGRNVVLLLEDQPFVRMAMVEALEAGGFMVVEISEPSEALAHLERATATTSQSALLTDIEMAGGMNGCELAWQVRQHSPDTPVLVVSGAPRPSAADLPPKARFLPKPTTPDGLADSLYEALRELEVLPR